MLIQRFESVRAALTSGQTVVLATSLLVAGGALGQGVPKERPILTRAELAAETPKSGNPYVSFLPAGVEPDYRYWNAYLRFKGEDKAAIRARTAVRGVTINETENNDSQGTANPLPLSHDAQPSLTVSGTTDAPPAVDIGAPWSESPNNDSIGNAIAVELPAGAGLLGTNQRIEMTGEIGDGPYGSSGTGDGDHDFFSVVMTAGQQLTVDLETPSAFGPLDPVVRIYDASGNPLAYNDDDPAGGTFDSFLAFEAPSGGTYYVCIGGYRFGGSGIQFPTDPLTPGTGQGVASEGTYDVIFGLAVTPDDYFAVDLRAGDILGVSSDIGSQFLSIIDPNGIERFGSSIVLSSLQPTDDLPTGAADASDVVAVTGTHYIRVRPTDGGGNAYNLDVELFRPKAETTGITQVIFVDFDGQTVNAPFWWGSGNNPAIISPLSSFLSDWGLLPGDEEDLIRKILANIEENLSDLEAVAPGTDYLLLNSWDHADPGFVYDAVTPTVPANTSRLIVGGTISELGISTIGIASAIDTGNFGFEDTGITLLDLLSAEASDPNSLNQFPLGGVAEKPDLVAAGVGNITTHEGGHFLGNWHTDQFNGIPAIQDQGGNLANSVGVGPDGIFGTADDLDVDFLEDEYVSSEPFSGIEHQPARTGFGLSTAIFTDGFESGDTASWQ